jgi:hypothetical protein
MIADELVWCCLLYCCLLAFTVCMNLTYAQALAMLFNRMVRDVVAFGAESLQIENEWNQMER